MKRTLVKIGDAYTVKRGTSISKKDVLPGSVPVVAGGLTYSYTHNTSNRSGGVVTISASGANAGFVNYWQEPIFASDCSTVEAKNDKADIKYLYFFLKNKQSFINDTMRSGAAQPHVYAKDIAALHIPLPSLAEQLRIAAVLDKAEEIKRKREAAITKLDQLAQSVFVEMFGDPLTNEFQLPTVKLEEIATKITDGEHLNPKFTDYGMPIVMAGNVLENGIALNLAKKVSTEDGHKFRKKCKPEINDLLLVSRGATIGRMTIINSSDEFCLMGSVILIKVNIDKVNPTYLTTLLKFPHMRSALYKTSGSSAQQAIYLKDLKKQMCLLPEIHNQNKFGEKIKSLNSTRKLHVKALHQTVNLFSSLQHQAFTTGFET